MAKEGTRVELNLTLIQGLKKYPKACFWSIALSTTIIMEGYDIVLIGSLYGQPAFAKAYGSFDAATNSYSLSAGWQAALSNGASVGTIIGAFLNGYMTQKYGYRQVMMLSLAVMIGCIFFPFFAPNLAVLLVGQICCGVPWGVFATMAPAYASEICPTALRAYLTVYVNLTWAFGQLVAAGVMSGFRDGTTKWAYKIPFAIQWIWPLPIMILVYFAPESPWHLVRLGRLDEAKKVIARISSNNDSEDHEKALAMLVRTNKMEIEIETGTSYFDCLKRSDLRRTEIMCMTFAAQPFCGSAMGSTPTYFMIQAGVVTTVSFKLAVGGLGLAAVGTIISWKLLHSFGRRTLYLWGLGMLAAILLTVGFISVAASHSSAGNYAQASCMLLWLFVYYLTVGPICYAIIGETSATRLRNKSVCLARISYYVANIIVNVVNPYMLNPTAENWKGKTGFFWGAWSIAFFVWTYFRLPEMKGRTYEELDLLFAHKVKTRDFKTTRIDTFNSEGNVVMEKVL